MRECQELHRRLAEQTDRAGKAERSAGRRLDEAATAAAVILNDYNDLPQLHSLPCTSLLQL